MKSAKKRFETASQIRDEITRQKARSVSLLHKADELDKEADFLARQGNPNLSEIIGFKRETAKRYRRSSRRIQDKRLDKLKNKLAEFLTDPFPGLSLGKDIQR